MVTVKSTVDFIRANCDSLFRKLTKGEPNVTKELKYRVRGDFLLCRIVVQDKVGSLAMPQSSQEGRKYIIVGIGEKVNDICIGEQIIIAANPGEGSYYAIPNSNGLFLIKAEFAALVVEDEEGNGCCNSDSCCDDEIPGNCCERRG